MQDTSQLRKVSPPAIVWISQKGCLCHVRCWRLWKPAYFALQILPWICFYRISCPSELHLVIVFSLSFPLFLSSFPPVPTSAFIFLRVWQTEKKFQTVVVLSQQPLLQLSLGRRRRVSHIMVNVLPGSWAWGRASGGTVETWSAEPCSAQLNLSIKKAARTALDFLQKRIIVL